MSPFWENLDKIGIVLGIVIGLAEIGQWIFLYRISEDVEDIQEEMEDQ